MKMKNIVIKLAKHDEFGYKFETNPPFWDKVHEIVDVLTSAYNFTVDMQRVGYGLSDMYYYILTGIVVLKITQDLIWPKN